MYKQFINGQFIIYNKKSHLFELYSGNMLVKSGRVKRFTNRFKKDVETTDLQGGICFPALINAHLHLGETLFRPLPHKMTLLEYINYTELKNKEFGDRKQLLWEESAHETIQESIRSGVLSVNTIRGQELLSQYEIQALSGYPIMKSEKLKKFCDSGLLGYKQFYEDCIKRQIRPGVFFHSFYMNDENSFNLAKKCAKFKKSFFATHIAEDKESEAKVEKIWGNRSLELLKISKLLSKKSILVHGNFLDKDELCEVAKFGANLVVCPASADTLNTQIQDVLLLENLKINWCIASDGLASGKSANLLEQTKVLVRDDVDLQMVLRAITVNPAKALGLKGEILGLNSKANFIVFDSFKFNGFNELLKSILLNNKPIKSVYNKGNHAEEELQRSAL